jgi:hypothetical protein
MKQEHKIGLILIISFSIILALFIIIAGQEKREFELSRENKYLRERVKDLEIQLEDFKIKSFLRKK